jgi:hypothetical protein
MKKKAKMTSYVMWSQTMKKTKQSTTGILSIRELTVKPSLD